VIGIAVSALAVFRKSKSVMESGNATVAEQWSIVRWISTVKTSVFNRTRVYTNTGRQARSSHALENNGITAVSISECLLDEPQATAV